jgi:hypothetical protein
MGRGPEARGHGGNRRKEEELGRDVGQAQALTALPSGRFDQNVVTQFGNIDGYQNGRRLSRLYGGHGWYALKVKVGIRSSSPAEPLSVGGS